jgi:hypothetical protein
MSYLGKAVLIGRGKNGWHCAYVGEKEPLQCGGFSQTTSSGSGGSLENYASSAPDGTPVYDADSAEVGSFAHLVIAGPMVDVRLQPGQVKKFGQDDKRTLLGMLPQLQGAFNTIGCLAMADLSSLDYVAVDVYLAILKENVPGVRFGTVKGGKVEWE